MQDFPLKRTGTWEESELDCWALGFSFSLCCNVEQLLGCQITVSTVSIWVFPKIGVPQNGWFIMENPIKIDFLGYHYFRKHPYVWERALRESLEIALSTSFLLKFVSLKAWSWWQFRLLGRTLFLRALLSRFGCSLSQHILKVCISASHQTGKETRLVQRS